MNVCKKFLQSKTTVAVLLCTETALSVMLLFVYTCHYNPPLTVSAHKIHFLHSKILLPASDILGADWITSLKDILSVRENLAKDKLVITVICTEPYYNVLVNWFAAWYKNTKIDVADVLIVVTEEEVYHSLRTRKLSVLYVRKESIIEEPERHSKFRQILMIRCSVTRVLNYWGYDVAMMDLDAIALRDPRSIFRSYPDAQVVASKGTFPHELSKLWGQTLCMGFVLFRSSSATGKQLSVCMNTAVCINV